jgi:hypothetical protein
MTVGVFSGTMYRNSALLHDYGIKILAGTRCKTPLRDFKKDRNSWDEVSF